MTDVRVGRLLPACLHQAIAEELPDRLEFYEHWLKSETWRDGAVGLAAIRAVLGFLRTEPADAYGRVMTRAGELAVEWHLEPGAGLRRTMIGWMPMAIRARAALRDARGLVAAVAADTRVSTRVRGVTAAVELRPSVFCNARDRQTSPLCGFYLALVLATLERSGFTPSGTIESCRAVSGGDDCRLAVVLDGASAGQARAA